MERDIGPRLSNAPSLARLLSRSDLTKPTPATCARIANFLRPEFERVAAPVSTNWREDLDPSRPSRQVYDRRRRELPNTGCVNDARGLGLSGHEPAVIAKLA